MLGYVPLVYALVLFLITSWRFRRVYRRLRLEMWRRELRGTYYAYLVLMGTTVVLFYGITLLLTQEIGFWVWPIRVVLMVIWTYVSFPEIAGNDGPFKKYN